MAKVDDGNRRIAEAVWIPGTAQNDAPGLIKDHVEHDLVAKQLL